mgnify:CR=1 FL=1
MNIRSKRLACVMAVFAILLLASQEAQAARGETQHVDEAKSHTQLKIDRLLSIRGGTKELNHFRIQQKFGWPRFRFNLPPPQPPTFEFFIVPFFD